MTEGLKLTFTGEELRKLLEERINDHQQCADRWTRERSRTSDDETEDAPSRGRVTQQVLTASR